jgi:hypothetical protein
MRSKAKAEGTSLKQFKIRNSHQPNAAPKPCILKRGVTKKGSYFQAQDPTTGAYLGLAKSAEAAARLVKDYRQDEPKDDDDSNRTTWLRGQKLVDHFTRWCSIYTDDKGKPVVPSDLSSCRELVCGNRDFVTHAPALYYICIMGKLGPFRTSLCARWRSAFKPQASVSVAPSTWSDKQVVSLKVSLRSLKSAQSLSRADFNAMVIILQQAVKDTGSIDLTMWTREVCHKNQYYSGWRHLLGNRFFGVIKSKSARALTTCGSKTSSSSRHKLELAQKAGLQLALLKSPKTLLDYKEQTIPIMSALAKIHPPGLNPDQDYSVPWLLRSHLFGISGSTKGLEVSRQFTMNEFLGLFPDGRQWLERYFKVS